ncbi:MAG TPA: SOS response-associated peptidase [Solirubrobacteraceae bacterium]|nr:SOS response-associated peptidase [Solirubrobacteraceae bacterium]
MCGRYSLAGPNPAQVRAAYPVAESVEVRRRFNVAPGDYVLAVTTSRDGAPRGELLRWGLVPSWAETPDSAMKMINARVETVHERPAYRSAFEHMRCLVLADGFYEWQRSAAGPKQAFHITAAGRSLFAYAGLWSVWHGADGSVLRTCTILTTAANAAIASLHDRMPVVLPRQVESVWLDPATPSGELRDLLAGLPAEMTRVRAVGPAVNDARYDGPACLEDAAPAQPALF